jgi:hypothetical protein
MAGVYHTKYDLTTHITNDSIYFNPPQVIEKKIEPYGTVYTRTAQELLDSLNDQFSVKRETTYPSSFIKNDLKNIIQEKFGYNIINIYESSFEEDDKTFTVYTAELDQEAPDYSKLLEEEWLISETLGLYDKNIVLRLL